VCQITGGSKKSHNWFSPLTGVLKNSKNQVKEPTLIHQFFHHFENHHFLKNFKNPEIEIRLILKLFKNQKLEVLRCWKCSKSGIGVSLICKIKKTQDLRFSTESKNHPNW
jgi:hypothetical protein